MGVWGNGKTSNIPVLEAQTGECVRERMVERVTLNSVSTYSKNAKNILASKEGSYPHPDPGANVGMSCSFFKGCRPAVFSLETPKGVTKRQKGHGMSRELTFCVLIGAAVYKRPHTILPQRGPIFRPVIG